MGDELGAALDSVELPSADEALTRSMFPGAWAHRRGGKVRIEERRASRAGGDLSAL